MDLVVDSSVAMAWVLPDENREQAEKILARIDQNIELWAPSLWWYEVASVVDVARRRKRLTEAQASRVLELLDGLSLQSDPPGMATTARIAELAHRHGLSAYDAAYLELAERRGAALATFDKALLKAARAAGVETV